jgi:hypothetical protein
LRLSVGELVCCTSLTAIISFHKYVLCCPRWRKNQCPRQVLSSLGSETRLLMGISLRIKPFELFRKNRKWLLYGSPIQKQNANCAGEGTYLAMQGDHCLAPPLSARRETNRQPFSMTGSTRALVKACLQETYRLPCDQMPNQRENNDGIQYECCSRREI